MKLKTQALLQTLHKLEWHSTKAKQSPLIQSTLIQYQNQQPCIILNQQ